MRQGQMLQSERARLPKQRPDSTLRGVVRVGNYSHHISKTAKIWKGRYKDEVVALRVFKLSHPDPKPRERRQELKEVSTPCNHPWRRIVRCYPDG